MILNDYNKHEQTYIISHPQSPLSFETFACSARQKAIDELSSSMASITRRVPLDYVALLVFSLTFALRMSVHDRMHKQDCPDAIFKRLFKKLISSFIPSSRHRNPFSLNIYSNAIGCVDMLMRIQLSVRYQFWHEHHPYTHPSHIFVVYCIR